MTKETPILFSTVMYRADQNRQARMKTVRSSVYKPLGFDRHPWESNPWVWRIEFKESK